MVAKVVGTTPSFPRVRGFELASGRFFDDEDGRAARRVAVLGARVRALLFAGEEAVGSRDPDPWRALRGRGHAARQGHDLGGSDEDTQVFVPIRTALRRVFNARALSTVFVSARLSDDGAGTEAEIRALLRDRHRLELRARSRRLRDPEPAPAPRVADVRPRVP